MAPHDSDSSGDEQDEYTETNVLLGYASKEPEDISRLGGRPEWIDPQTPPSAALARCGACGDLMVLLLQLNAELPADFPGHERRLYVFACRRKTCRQKPGSIRALRGVRVEPGSTGSNGNSNSNGSNTNAKATTAAGVDKKENGRQQEQEKKEEEPRPPASNLGETLFGATTLGSSSSGSANPFSTGGSGSGTSTSNPFASLNPFSNSSTPAAAPAAPVAVATSESSTASPDSNNGTKDPEQEMQSLPKTFAETLSLNNPQSTTPTSTPTSTSAPAAPEPWPPESEQPRPYPVSYLTEAEYETLDPTPAPVSQATVQMDVDEPSTSSSKAGKGGGKGKDKEDRDVFESSMDAAFQKFADRLAQNPEQAIRYEFGGQPLLYSRGDAVGALLLGKDGGGGGGGGGAAEATGIPRCGNCGARRLFEVQLCPHAIAELEADELSLEGMDWGTVIVGVCERDCQPRGLAERAAGYLEEWAGVQWEELTGTGGRR